MIDDLERGTSSLQKINMLHVVVCGAAAITMSISLWFVLRLFFED
jgi:hypothetical protein